MSEPKVPNIRLEKISLERLVGLYEAVLESSQEWFAAGMIDKPELSIEELETGIKE